MKRKRMILALTALSVMMLATGCKKGPVETVEKPKETNKQELVELKLWGSKEDQDLLTELTKSFQKKYANEAKFKFTLEPVAEGDCRDVLLDNVNDAADVFALVDDQVMTLAASGVLDPLEHADSIRSKHVEGAIDAASIDGKLYSYPMTADNGYFLYYNKKYLSNKNAKTMDDILKVAASKGKKFTMDITDGWYLYSFFGNTGLSLQINADGVSNSCDWNSTNKKISGKDVVNSILSIVNHSGFQNGNDQVLLEGAKNNSVVAGVSGVWLGNALKEIWKDDLVAVKLPTYTCSGQQVQMASYAGYKLVGVNAYSKEKKWAHLLAEWLTSSESQLKRFEARGLGPSNVETSKEKQIQESKPIQALLEQSPHSSLQRISNTYWFPVKDFMEKVIKGEVTAKNAQFYLDKMVASVTKVPIE